MLIIRQKQLDDYILQDEDEFVRFLMQHIREESPERVADYPDNLLEEMVRTGIERAKLHGFERPEDLSSFVAIMFEIAPNFDEQTEIKEFLDDEQTPTDEKLEKILETASEEAWAEAEESYDADAWFPIQDDEIEDNLEVNNAEFTIK